MKKILNLCLKTSSHYHLSDCNLQEIHARMHRNAFCGKKYAGQKNNGRAFCAPSCDLKSFISSCVHFCVQLQRQVWLPPLHFAHCTILRVRNVNLLVSVVCSAWIFNLKTFTRIMTGILILYLEQIAIKNSRSRKSSDGFCTSVLFVNQSVRFILISKHTSLHFQVAFTKSDETFIHFPTILDHRTKERSQIPVIIFIMKATSRFKREISIVNWRNERIQRSWFHWRILAILFVVNFKYRRNICLELLIKSIKGRNCC